MSDEVGQKEPSQDQLLELLDKVGDERTFLAFVKALAADREDEAEKERLNPSSPYGPGANGWENVTIESFFRAAIAWAEDSQFGRNGPYGKSGRNAWSQFAQFLYAGKVYE